MTNDKYKDLSKVGGGGGAANSPLRGGGGVDNVDEGRLELPSFDVKLRRGDDGKVRIFDILRRRYIVLTPEEWVRQHFINYLVTQKGYPKSLLVNETEIRLGAKKLRCDSVCLGRNGKPCMIMEYKAPTVKLTQKAFDQIAAYNLLLHVDYLILSNGMQHICCRMDYEHQTYQFLNEIPEYNGKED